MVFVPPGTIRMGSPTNEVDRFDWEGPLTDVIISRGYWMRKYEVTQGEYQEVMGNNPSWFNGIRYIWDPESETHIDVDLTDPTRPVETVSWNDAVTYCAALTERERLAERIAPNSVYRLPTEAEWEYACRAWTSTRFSYGDDPGYTNLTNYAWYAGNTDDRDWAPGAPLRMTLPVGQKLPNPWGLYDMHGNVWEWCQDWYGEYGGGIALDPQGPDTGWGRVVRGGWVDNWISWGVARLCRSASRGGASSDTRGDPIGFRVVLAPGPSEGSDN
jgi:formylglycine-generating enzyme required for sulfatase activity